MAAPPLVAQTTYAELLERCAGAAFHDVYHAGQIQLIKKLLRTGKSR